MQQDQAKAKKAKQKPKLVHKPYLTGPALSKTMAKRSIRLLGYQLIFVLFNLLLGTALSFENSLALRLVTNLFLVAAYAAFVYMDGARAGDADVAFAEIAYTRKESGKNVAQSDLERCYNKAKGFATVGVGAGILFLTALVFALIAKKQTYSLQALPGWVSAFQTQQDISLPLQYYSRTYAMTAEDVLRMIVRTCIYPFVNMAGVRSKDALFMVDKLSPILIMIPFIFYGLGYLQGPRSRAMVHGSIETATRRHKRKEKRERQARQQKTNTLV